MEMSYMAWIALIVIAAAAIVGLVLSSICYHQLFSGDSSEITTNTTHVDGKTTDASSERLFGDLGGAVGGVLGSVLGGSSSHSSIESMIEITGDWKIDKNFSSASTRFWTNNKAAKGGTGVSASLDVDVFLALYATKDDPGLLDINVLLDKGARPVTDGYVFENKHGKQNQIVHTGPGARMSESTRIAFDKNYTLHTTDKGAKLTAKNIVVGGTDATPSKDDLYYVSMQMHPDHTVGVYAAVKRTK